MPLEVSDVIASYINQVKDELLILFAEYEILKKPSLLQMIGEEFDKAHLATLYTL